MFQLMSALEGYAEAHASEKDKSLTGDETDDLWDWLKSKDPIIIHAKN